VKTLTALFILVLILIVIAANMGLAPTLFAFLRHIPYGDKLGHFVLMGTLSLLVNLSMHASRVRIGSADVLKGSLIVAAIVTIEEFSQIFIRSRGFSLVDLAFDYAGIVAFGTLASYLVNRRTETPEGRSTLTSERE
jgi:polysaccharide biosynthesis protein VpsQ